MVNQKLGVSTMSRYAQNQEYRLLKHLEELDYVEILRYYGSREKFKGDVLIKVGGVQIRIDHKSTENKEFIRFDNEWLHMLNHYCTINFFKEGRSSPGVTLSLKGMHQIYIAVPYGNTLVETDEVASIDGKKRVKITREVFGKIIKNYHVRGKVIEAVKWPKVFRVYRLEAYLKFFYLNAIL